jgi:hypothetical protein
MYCNVTQNNTKEKGRLSPPLPPYAITYNSKGILLFGWGVCASPAMSLE